MVKKRHEEVMHENRIFSNVDGNEKQWLHSGLECVLRHGFGGYCGYVRVPEESDLYGKNYSEIERAHPELEVHGGITFSGSIDAQGWYLGFDTLHACDISWPDLMSTKSADWVVAETNRFADQIANIITNQ